MKPILHLLIIAFLALPVAALSQDKSTSPTKLFRLYEDNDFINLRGKGTDRAYTNGTRFDVFYTKKKPSRFFIDKLLPKGGDSAVTIYGWGAMQMMTTPSDISRKETQPADYPYAGALFAIRSLYSYHPVKKVSWQTEVMAGVRGPSAFAKQTQTFFHDAINYQRPMGWDNQLPDKLILNINMVAEKGLAAYNNWLEMIGGAQVMAGTLVNNVGVYSILRLGKMSPYFNGIMQQFSSASGKRKNAQTQAYIILKPAVILNAANSLLNEGAQSNNWKTSVANVAEIKRIVYRMSGGFVFTINKVSLSVTQQVTSALMKNMYSHEVGNISLYVSM